MSDKTFKEKLFDCKDNILNHITVKKQDFESYNMNEATHIIIPLFMRSLFYDDGTLDFSNDKIMNMKILWSMDCSYDIKVLRLIE